MSAFKRGFKIGSKVGKVIFPLSIGAVAGYYAYEGIDYLTQNWSEKYADVFEYGGAAGGGLAGTGCGYVIKITYIPQAVFGTVGGIVGLLAKGASYPFRRKKKGLEDKLK